MLTNSTRTPARCDAEHQQDAAAQLDQRDSKRGRARRRKIQRREELRYAIQVSELAPAVLRKLPSPVEPDSKQQRALRPVCERGKLHR